MIAGLALFLSGGLVFLSSRVGLPLGRLPGDIHIEREGFSFYFPLASSIIVSVALTITIHLIGKFLNK